MSNLIGLSLNKNLLPALALSIFLASTALGQSTAARPDRGFMPGASYSISDIENISLTNGNVNVSIPLASLPPVAGGKLGFTLNAVYNSKLWNITRSQQQRSLMEGCQSWVVDTPQLSDLGGWRISGHYYIVFRNAHEDFDYVVPQPPGTPDCESDSQEQLLLQDNWYRAILIAPDGSEHELRPTDGYQYYSGSREYLRNYYNMKPDLLNAPMRYYSLDGSYLSVIINPSSYGTQWTVYMKDGTQVIQYSSGIQRIKDTNGNSIKIYGDTNGMHYQDEQTGREIRYGADGKIWYQTVGGGSHSIDIVWGTTTVQGKVYRVNAWMDGGGETGGGTACWHDEPLQTQLSVIREIVFPVTEPGQAGRRFTFNYNSDTTSTASDEVQWSACDFPPQTYTRTVSKGMGELNEITTPAGAVVRYSYSRDQVHNLGEPDEIAKGTVTQKQVTHDGTTDTWTYSIDEFGGTGGCVTAPDGSLTTESAYSSKPGFGQYFGSGSKAGLVYRSSLSGKQIVERHWITTPFGGANSAATGAALPATFNPLVDAEYLSIVNASGVVSKMSAKTYQYDYNGNLIQETDYDWFDPSLVTRDSAGVPTGVPGSATVLRTSANTYYNAATSASSGNVYAKRSLSTATPLILNALQQSTTGPAIVQFNYDEQAYGVAPTVGNLTSQSVWDDLDNKWITSSQTYGLYGNLATKTDPRGKFTQFFYDDATHALPNRVIVDPQNGTGTQMSTTAYDYYTGLVTSQADANGNTSTIDYTNQLLGTVDPVGRPGVTIGPLVNAGGTNQHHRVTATYLDSARQVIMAADLNSENDKLLKTRTTADMLGRPILFEQTEDGTTYTVSSRKVYAQMGKITYSSNPARSAAASTDGWTRATTDTIGRVIEVATFGGATQPPATGTNGTWTGSVATTYDANAVTVTDQNGKARKSVSDALGRLIQVYEDPSGLNYQTNYTYDVFGNLLTVVQGAQTRTFTYDSISRLRTAVNPESGTITYVYDDNGNLTQKTDARGVVSNYVYDALNRNTSVTYTNDPTSTPAITRTYDLATNGKGRFYQSQTSGATGSLTTIDSYDAMGRAPTQRQQFYAGGAWSQSYTTQRSYNLAGGVIAQTLPSGHNVSYAYESAGRLNSFTGNLGDGVQRTYATGITYAAGGQMAQEQFGTTTPVYNKLVYNSRQQLAEILASTTPGDSSWNRGKILNQYSLQCSGAACNATDNNGNLRKQEVHIPNNSSSTSWYQQYDYDSLNRLHRVSEYTGNTQLDSQQEYVYDRWGNRKIHQTNTWGSGINKKDSAVNTANNRLSVPAGQSGVMTYDSAGNLTTDTYSGSGVTRVYDAENRMTSETQANNLIAGTYIYNADGQRVRRNVGSVETWQVYGLDGELLAEYAANAAPTSPQKEYGYRNGQLLITAEPTARTNVAAVTNGGAASASSQESPYTTNYTNDGERLGYTSGQYSFWRDNTNNTWPDWLQIDFNGSKTIDEIDVFTVQDNAETPATPTEAMTFSLHGVTAFDVQYWNGSSWLTITGGSVTGNNKVWRKFTFAAITTSKIRVTVNAALNNRSRIVELEAYGTPAGPARTNVGLAANGGAATASSQESPYTTNYTNDGERLGYISGQYSFWRDNTNSTWPDWLQIDFNGSKTIDEIDVFTVQDNAETPSEPTESLTFSLHGITAFDVQYWDGSAWVTVPNGSVTGNNKVWRKFTFAAITTSKIRVTVNGALNNRSRIVEVEAWGTVASGGSSANIQWLVSDQLGTPRMVFDQTGSLATMKRHDYLPFGEELFASQDARTTQQGYVADNMRQKFTSKERDTETGLDYFLARYYSSTQGRFTSPDEFSGGPDELFDFAEDAAENPTFYADLNNPQSLNKYQYAYNNPLRYIDPDGHDADDQNPQAEEPQEPQQQQNNQQQPKRPPAQKPYLDPVSGCAYCPFQERQRRLEEWLKEAHRFDPKGPDINKPVPIPPLVPTPPQQMSPRPIDKPRDKGHKKGKRHDKHTRRTPGESRPPGFKPRTRPRPQDMPPEPPKPPKPPKPSKGKANEWEP